MNDLMLWSDDLGMLQLIFVVGLGAMFILFHPVRNFFFGP